MKYSNNINEIIDDLLFKNLNTVILDVYYHLEGHPKYLHDKIGGTKSSELLKKHLISQIKERNNAEKVFQVSSYGFGIIHSIDNCTEFDIEIEEIFHHIGKRIVKVST